MLIISKLHVTPWTDHTVVIDKVVERKLNEKIEELGNISPRLISYNNSGLQSYPQTPTFNQQAGWNQQQG